MGKGHKFECMLEGSKELDTCDIQSLFSFLCICSMPYMYQCTDSPPFSYLLRRAASTLDQLAQVCVCDIICIYVYYTHTHTHTHTHREVRDRVQGMRERVESALAAGFEVNQVSFGSCAGLFAAL